MIRIARPRLALLAGALLLAGAAMWWWSARAPAAGEMLSWLPEGEGATLYVDFALLRRTGVLARLSGFGAVEEVDYRGFVEATGFDYARHLDGALVRFRDDATLFVLAGQFDRGRLERYAIAQGGRCVNGLCTMAASTPGRHVSFLPLGRRALALATATDPMAATLISRANRTAAPEAPMSVVWLTLPGSRLRSTAGLPPGVSAFLEAMRGAERAVLLVRPTPKGVDVVLEAPCASPAAAGAVASRLTSATEMLKSLLAREQKEPDPLGLSGVLTSGSFRADQAVVRGFWPVPKEFLEGFTSGGG